MVAKYLGNADADLPSFVRMGPTGNAGAGYLGPEVRAVQHRPRRPAAVLHQRRYLDAEAEERRADLLRLRRGRVRRRTHKAEPFESHRIAKERAWRLLRAKGVVRHRRKEWPKAKDRYGDTEFGRGCFLARKLVEAGVPFVEVGQDNYDSHADNFVCHKANMQRPRPGLVGAARST